MHQLAISILLGIGAAAPLGPVNLEIIRRNLRFGFLHGTFMGAGACLADLVYLILLSLGMLSLFQSKEMLQLISGVGALILAWFGVNAIRSRSTVHMVGRLEPAPTLLYQGVSGFLVTMINPYTILFWSSVSAQISVMSGTLNGILISGSGVIIGTFGWVPFLNFLMHLTRHVMSARLMRILNISGGLVLLGFAGMGLINVFK